MKKSFIVKPKQDFSIPNAQEKASIKLLTNANTLSLDEKIKLVNGVIHLLTPEEIVKVFT